MQPNLTAKINLSEFNGLADRVRRLSGDKTRINEAMANTVRELVVGVFEDQADPWGNAWMPLSDVTLMLRRKKGAGAKALLDTGQLSASITARATAKEAEVSTTGATADYAHVHQFGNPENRMFGGPKAPVPARPYFPIRGTSGSEQVDMPDEWLMDMIEAVDRRLESLARGA